MGFKPLEIQTLIDLGLTLTQTRIYLALAKFGKLKISSISKQSRVARSDVYRTLAKLQELGLVEQCIEAPVRFIAIPIDEGLKLLMQNKTQEYKKIGKETESLLTTFKSSKADEEIQTTHSQFILIPEKERVIEKQKEAIDASQNSIDLILTWNRLRRGTGNLFAHNLRNALDRNVKFRVLLEKPRTEKLIKQALKLTSTPLFEIRFLETPPKTILTIYDRNELVVIVDPQIDLLGKSPALWTNNRSFIALVQDYFDISWLTALDILNYSMEDPPV